MGSTLFYNSTPQYRLVATATNHGALNGTIVVSGISGTIALIVVAIGSGSTSPSMTDSSGNTYSYTTAYGSGVLTRQAYVVNPTTASSMTFTITALNWSAVVMVFSTQATVTPALDQQTGNNSIAATSIATGSITPLFSTELIVASAATGSGSTGSPGVVAGYNLIFGAFFAGVSQGIVVYYKSQLYIQAENVAFAGTSMQYYGALIASYKN